eukprot:SAG31_NODE_3289_length_4458_cov_2.567791_4_plen_143_part_00
MIAVYTVAAVPLPVNMSGKKLLSRFCALEKYGTFIARCNALIEKVSPFIAFSGLREIGSVTLVHFLGFVFSCTSTTLLALATGNSKTIHAAGQAKLLKPGVTHTEPFDSLITGLRQCSPLQWVKRKMRSKPSCMRRKCSYNE